MAYSFFLKIEFMIFSAYRFHILMLNGIYRSQLKYEIYDSLNTS